MKLLTIIVTILFFTSCMVPKRVTMNEKSVLPLNYKEQGDSVSSAVFTPARFFPSVELKKLIDSVLVHNYDLRIASQRVKMARAQVLQTRAASIPSLSLSLMPSLRKFGLFTMDGAGNIVTDIEGAKRVPIDLPDLYGGMQSFWEIDLWGKIKAGRQAASLRINSNLEQQNLLRTMLVAETASAYYQLMAADEELKMLRDAIVLQERAAELMRIQKDAGRVNELAVQQFDAQVLSIRALQLQVEQEVTALETMLNQLSGRPFRSVSRDTIFFDLSMLPAIEAGLPSALLLNRPDIRMAEWDVLAARADLQAARAAFLPALTLSAAAGLQGYRPGVIGMLPESIAYSAISGLAAPVLNRRGLKAGYERVSAQQQEALLHFHRTVLQSFNEVQQQLVQLAQLESRYVLKEKETSVLTASISVATELFKTGRANYLDVLLANQRLLMSNIERIQTRREQLLLVTALYRSLGGGWKN